MFPLDIIAWEKFLDSFSFLYDSFQYDVMCGHTCYIHPHWQPEYKKNAEVLSRMRIDAVGFRSDGIDIIEVKPKLTASSLGQVFTYKEHYINEYNPSLPVRAVIVADESNQNVEDIALKNGIMVVIV